ncbi:MAG: hypothetical protein Q9167_003529 [Letrouitia subvulpina]
MAEVVAVGASVIAVIQIADRIIGLCKFYIETAQDAPPDLRIILVETSALKAILENLIFLTACDGPLSAADRHISGANGPIEGCLLTVAELEKLFPSDGSRTTARKNSKKRRLDSVLTALAWPLKESKARKLLDDMTRYKTTIGLALTTNSIQDVKEIKEKASQIHDMLTESQRREMYRWLQHTDPSPFHYRAQKDYEPGTGNWILRSPEWADWLAGKHRCLWIHGIPGAGKTVLISYLIEQIGKLCDQTSYRKSIYVYYYCYFAHNQDETKPFLKWLIGRLCREAGGIPTYVYDLNRHGTEPNLTALLKAIDQLLVSFETVYIAIDAIDESSSQDDFLQILRSLGTDRNFKKLQLIISSRDYINIEKVMLSFSVSIPMNNFFVEQDIKHHVRSNLQSNSQFDRWPRDLLHEVEESITKGAGGIKARFRWAVCQIDSLQRLKCEREIIQKALRNLPKTLDETYDRILFAVPKEERLFVDCAFQWIAHHSEIYDGQGIPYEVLIEATEASILSLTGNQNERFYDKDTLREVCGCLIDISPEDYLDEEGYFHHPYISVTFAHYSVHEYLNSNRTLNANFIHRTIGGRDPKDHLLKTTLSEAQRIKPNDLWELKMDSLDIFRAVNSRLDLYCVLSALLSLRQFSVRICQDNTLKRLAIDLLDPSMPHFPTMEVATFVIEHTTLFSSLRDADFWAIQWHPDTNTELKHLYNLLLLTESCAGCLPLAETFLQGKDLKSLLQAQVCFSIEVWYDEAAYTFNGSLIEVFAQSTSRLWPGKALEFLMEVGAGVFDPSVAFLLYIGGHIHSYCEDFCPLQRLLELGADPNLRGYQITPLQIATVSSDLNGVERLLKAGALPNDTGSPDGVIWGEDSLMHRLNHLHGASPLRICRDFARIFMYKFYEVEPDVRKKIEELLLDYGAEAFSTTCELDMQEKRTNAQS